MDKDKFAFLEDDDLVKEFDDIVDLDFLNKNVNVGQEQLCIRCGRPIGRARLDAMPGTNICAKCIRPDIDGETHDINEDLFGIDTTNITDNQIHQLHDNIKKRIETELDIEFKKLKNREQDLYKNEQELDKNKQELDRKLQDAEKNKEILEDALKVQQDYRNRYFLVLGTAKRVFIENLKLKLENDNIVMFPNECIYTERSPVIKGFARINNTDYEVSMWINKDENNSVYWAGYLNIYLLDENKKAIDRIICGKILIKREGDSLNGYIVIKGEQMSISITKNIRQDIEFKYLTAKVEK